MSSTEDNELVYELMKCKVVLELSTARHFKFCFQWPKCCAFEIERVDRAQAQWEENMTEANQAQNKRTPLHEVQQAAGATFGEWLGWEMPAVFSDVRAEHSA